MNCKQFHIIGPTNLSHYTPCFWGILGAIKPPLRVRTQVLKRDNYQCRKCFRKDVNPGKKLVWNGGNMGIEKSRTQEITILHQEFANHLRTCIEKGIRIGELLTEQKASLPHGQFGKWIETNLPFTTRTAQHYMRLHTNRHRLKNETVSHLTEAYKLLAPPEDDLDTFDREVETARMELIGLEAMMQHFENPNLPVEERMRGFKYIHDKALIMQNRFMEHKIRADRELGRLSTELSNWLIKDIGTDFTRAEADQFVLMHNEEIIAMLNERISQLEQGN